MVGHIAGTQVPINMRRGQKGNIQLAPERLSDLKELTKVIQGGFEQPLIFTIEDDPPQREMSRFLCKMALETVAELFVPNPEELERLVDEPFFDNIRTFARHGTNFDAWPFSQRRVFPIDTLMRHPTTNEWVQAGFGCGLFMNARHETFFAFLLYGVEFVVNVGGPSIAGYKEWLQENDNISPVVERLGCRLVAEEEGLKKTYYLHGSFEVKKGLEFDKARGYAPFRVDSKDAYTPVKAEAAKAPLSLP